MTATTAAPAAPRSSTVNPQARLTFFGVLHSEWGKFWSLRSTYWVIAIATMVGVGFSAIMALAVKQMAIHNPEQLGNSFGGAALPQVLVMYAVFCSMVVATLGVLTVTGEYSTGQIRSTLTAVPSRLPVFAAKAITVTVSSALLSVVIGLASTGVASMLAGSKVNLSLSEGGNLRGLIALVVFWVAMSLMGLGIGFLLRHTAGSVTVVMCLMFVLWIILQMARGALTKLWEPLGSLIDYLPTSVGTALMMTEPPTSVGHHTNMIMLACWAFLPLIAGAVTFKVKDA